MWCTIENMLRRIANEAKKEEKDGNGMRMNIVKGYYRDGDFLNYLTIDTKSPLRSSMRKAGIDEQEAHEWVRRLWWPYGEDHQTITQWSKEANRMSKRMAALAKEEASKDFHAWIDLSLENGSKEIHKYVRNERRKSPRSQGRRQEAH